MRQVSKTPSGQKGVEWKLPEPEPAPRERKRDTSPVNWSAVIDQRVGNTREYLLEVLAETIAELSERQREAIDDAMKPPRTELAGLRLANCELRAANAELREQLTAGHVADLPPLPLRNSRAN